MGGGAALAFSVALLASGASASSVGTCAGQVVMRGFIGLNIPVLLRRLVTMAPAIAVLAIGLGPTQVLVFSQVVLSFGIPFALIPLVLLASNARSWACTSTGSPRRSPRSGWPG
jgi:manganese transport protein